MTRYGFWRPVLITLVSAIFLLASFSTAGTMEGKVPITTSSDQALKYFLQGRDLGERLRGPDARTYYEKAVAADPDFALGHLNLALVQPTAKGFWKHFNTARTLVDNVSEGERMMILGLEAGTNAEPLKQRKIYKDLVAAYPNDERAHNLLGTNYFGQQNWDEAIVEYKTATKINPEFSQAYNQLGYAYRFIEKYDEAEKAFQKYIQLIPDDPNPYDSYAELLMKMGRYDESIKNYEKALAIDPTFAASHIGIATDLNFLNRHADARKQLQKLYNSAVDDGQRRAAHFAMAVSYIDEGKTDEALKEIQNQYLIAERINDYAAMSGDHIAMGNILYEAGQYDKALAHYKKSVEMIEMSDLNEEVKETTRRNNLFFEGRVALMKGDLTTAKAKSELYSQKASANNNPGEIRLAHELRGMIALETKDYKTAHADLLKANQQNPSNLYRLAVAYKGQGENEAAKKMCQKAANFNQLNSLNQAFVKHKAKKMMAGM